VIAIVKLEHVFMIGDRFSEAKVEVKIAVRWGQIQQQSSQFLFLSEEVLSIVTQGRVMQ
jgi:hypothetical protein